MFKFLKDANIYNRFVKEILTPQGISFNYDVCFSNWVDDDYDKSYDSQKYKEWFQNLIKGIGDINILYNFWLKNNEDIANSFKLEFIDKYNNIAKNNNYDLISTN